MNLPRDKTKNMNAEGGLEGDRKALQYHPHEYQTFATDFILSHPVSAILLSMGLGKSVITLTAIKELLTRGEVQRILVIAPLRVARDTWPEEIRKWDHLHDLTYAVAIGSPKERCEALRRDVMIHIINRENIPWLVNESGIPFSWDMIVIDELSSFKSWKAQRFKALMKVRPFVKRIVGLTGTPAPNGYMDLFAEYRLLDQGQRLGRFISRYREAYFIPDRWGNGQVFSWKLRRGAEEEIWRKIQDITVSMKSVDHLKMPECVMNKVSVYMNARERLLYETLKDDLFLKIISKSLPLEGTKLCRPPVAEVSTELRSSETSRSDYNASAPIEDAVVAEGRMRCLEATVDAKNAAVLCGKLAQLANGAIYTEEGNVAAIHDRKLDALEDLIESANGNPLLVAYWFQHDIWRIKERFPEIRVLRSPEDFRDWNAGKIPVAAIHPASAGHGLNLQAGGSTLVWFGLTWSLELYQQTNARLWRQGQRAETVVIHHIIAEDTIDERIMAALKGKDQSQERLIDAVKAQFKSLPLEGTKLCRPPVAEISTELRSSETSRSGCNASAQIEDAVVARSAG